MGAAVTVYQASFSPAPFSITQTQESEQAFRGLNFSLRNRDVPSRRSARGTQMSAQVHRSMLPGPSEACFLTAPTLHCKLCQFQRLLRRKGLLKAFYQINSSN